LQVGSVRIDNPKAIRVAVGRNTDVRSGRPHLFPQIFEQVIVRFRRMSPK